MVPLTPIAVVLIGIWIIARTLTTVPELVTLTIGIIAIVCGLVDLALRGHRIP